MSPKIVSLRPIRSIKPGPDSAVLPDGTLVNPILYDAADIAFDDGITVQVERPLTQARVQNAYRRARTRDRVVLDQVGIGQDIA